MVVKKKIVQYSCTTGTVLNLVPPVTWYPGTVPGATVLRACIDSINSIL
eukprot:SAG11_NODE_16697_length_540_cov_0.861678_1_plen_48_part_10